MCERERPNWPVESCKPPVAKPPLEAYSIGVHRTLPLPIQLEGVGVGFSLLLLLLRQRYRELSATVCCSGGCDCTCSRRQCGRLW